MALLSDVSLRDVGRRQALTDVHDSTAVPAAPPARALGFTNVSKRFLDGTQAIEDVSLDVRSGEFISIVGPSGCGKSTLLRIAPGLTEPTTGGVHVDSRSLGYVFQDPTLLPWRTLRGNIELPAQLHALPRKERRRLVDDAIRLVRLTGFEKHYPIALSGGMRMRVSLARALTLKPLVFLFDEPFSALDEITRERLNEELERLFLHERFSGLFVTHSISEAIVLSSRVFVMSSRPGRILAEIAVPSRIPALASFASSQRSPSWRARSPKCSAETHLSLDQRSSSVNERDLKRSRRLTWPRLNKGSLRAIKRAGLTAGPPMLVLAAFIGVWNYVSYEALDAERRFLLPPPVDV